LFTGNGNGTFQPQVTYPSEASPVGITSGDFTGDGQLDVAITEQTSGSSGTGTVSIFVPAAVGPEADLSITQAASTIAPVAGTTLTYRIAVHNAGPADAPSVVVNDTLPAGVFFLSGPCTGTVLLSCNQGTLASGASKNFDVQVRIPANYLSSRNDTTVRIVNKVSVTSVAADPNPANNTSSLSTDVSAAAYLKMTMTGTPNPVHEGGTVTYNMSFTNAGPSDAIQGNIVDYLPPGFNFVSSSALPCGGGVGVVLCNLGPVVPAGFSLSFPVQARVPTNFLSSGATSGQAINTATIYSDTVDAHPGDVPISVTTTVVP
jgi:uncharacterized repeat protein (TIGR01451 family)